MHGRTQRDTVFAMAKINSDLFARIKKKLKIGDRAAYDRISDVVQRTHLERHIAALYLARELRIAIEPYSTAAERAELRMASGRPEPVITQSIPSAVATPPQTRSKSVTKRSSRPERSVFVIHGRDHALTTSVYQVIRSLGLTVLEWNDAVKKASKTDPNPVIADIIHKVMEDAGALVVLFSPDDEVKLKDHFCGKEERETEGKLRGQARPNVLFESGLALGLHPRKTLLVQVGQIKPFSDVGGKHIMHLRDTIQSRNEFANKLEGIVGTVNRTGNDWQSVGKLESTPANPKARAAKKRRSVRRV